MSNSNTTLEKIKNINFSMNSYPKSYASTKLGDYRLKDFLDFNDNSLKILNNKLFDLCIKHESAVIPRSTYKDYVYLTSGWEWSVFKKPGKNIVVKIPADIFLEVNELIYLENSEDTYKKFVASYPSELVAETRFYKDSDTNIIEQEFIEGQIEFKVDLNTKDKLLLENFKIFLEGTLKLLKDYQWWPDYWLTDTDEGILVRNVILEGKTKLFKIIDFTQYLDPSRMYPAKTKVVIEGQIKKLKSLITSVETQLGKLEKNKESYW